MDVPLDPSPKSELVKCTKYKKGALYVIWLKASVTFHVKYKSVLVIIWTPAYILPYKSVFKRQALKVSKSRKAIYGLLNSPKNEQTMSWVLGPESRVSGWDGGGCSGRTPIYPTFGGWAYPIDALETFQTQDCKLYAYITLKSQCISLISTAICKRG